MILQGYLDDQVKLNAHLDTQPSLDQVKIAATTELGEFMQEVKGEWFWWPRPGKSYEQDRDAVLSEAMDLHHFLLVGMLIDGQASTERVERVDARWATFGEHVEEFSLHSLLADLSRCVGGGMWAQAVLHLRLTLKKLGFTDYQFDAAWTDSINKNLSRWRPEG